MEINKIYCENNLETMARMPDSFVDLVITSPPYNIGKNRINGNFQTNINYSEYDDNLNIDDYILQTTKWIDELLRITKYHIFWNIQEVTGNKGIIAFLMNHYKENIKEVFIWAKTNTPPSIVETMCGSGYEYIFCFSKDNPKSRKFNYCNFNNRLGGNNLCHNVLINPVNSGKGNEGHSFAFADWLPNFFINKFSKEGDIIYDPFIGSGTTAKSAHIYKRNWIGSEISQEYVDIANKRLEPYLKQKTLF